MKHIFLLVLTFFTVTELQAACHRVVDRSDEYPDPREPLLDQLCIDENDHVTFYLKSVPVYAFQSKLEIRNTGYRCVRRREDTRCGYFKGDLFLAYADENVFFEAHVDETPQVNFGAQYLEFQGRTYKFWVKGRR